MILNRTLQTIANNPTLIGYLAPIILGLIASFVYLVGKFASKPSSMELDKRQILITGFNNSLDAIIVPLAITYFFWNQIPSNVIVNIGSVTLHYILFIPLELALENIKTKGAKSPLWTPHYPSLKIFQNQKIYSTLHNKVKSLGFESTEHLSTIIFSTLNLLLLSVSIKSWLYGNKYALILMLLSIYFYYGNFNVIVSCSSFGRSRPTLVKITKYDGERITGILVNRDKEETKVAELTISKTELIFTYAKHIGSRLNDLGLKPPDMKDNFSILEKIQLEDNLDRKLVQKLVLNNKIKARNINSDEIKDFSILMPKRSEKIGFHLERYLITKIRDLRTYLHKMQQKAYGKLKIEQIKWKIKSKKYQ